MRNLLLLALIFAGRCPHSAAQAPPLGGFKPYAEAAVVLATGVVLAGELRFYYDRDVVAVTAANGDTYTLAAAQVRGFAARDAATAQRAGDTFVALQRVFRTFPVAPTRRSPSGVGFYEQLSRGPGPVLLLRREGAILVDVPVPALPPSAQLPTGRPAGTVVLPGVPTLALYLATATGPVVGLRKPADVFRYFARHAAGLRAYARQNNLRYADNLRDLAFLVDHANSLSQSQTATP